VYVFSPLLGGAAASLFFIRLLEPAMEQASDRCECKADKLESAKKGEKE
jgi:hypothetical protein